MSKKILSVLMTVVLVVATLCITAVSASALTGTVYFEVPADWGEYETIYCHYWGDGITSPDWQTEAEVCTEAADGIYGYVLPEGTTGFIFSANSGIQTADLSLTEDCIGKVGKAAARVEGENVAVASWDEPTVELAEVTPVILDTEDDAEAPADGKISGKIYFEVPDTWKNFETIYCHYWDADGNGPSWQSAEETCEKVSDKIYGIELPEGAWEFAIFSNDNGMQTGNTPITANEIGKVMYLTGNKVENPVNGEEVDEALWKDYVAEETPADSKDDTTESKDDTTEEKANNLWLYIVIAAVVVVLVIVIIVVAKKKKK